MPRNASSSDKGIKNSGGVRKFQTGAHRDLAYGKGAFDLLPYHGLFEVALIFEHGAIRYTKNNYRLGMPLSEYIKSGLRHMVKAGQGWDDENHAAMAAWNMMAFIETRAMIKNGFLPQELDDIDNWLTKEGVQKAFAKIKAQNERRIRDAHLHRGNGTRRKKRKVRDRKDR